MTATFALAWRRVGVFLMGGKRHRITYAEILSILEPLNEGRDERDRIRYHSLWVHAKRHYDIEGIEAYWCAQMHRELTNALRAMGRKPIE